MRDVYLAGLVSIFFLPHVSARVPFLYEIIPFLYEIIPFLCEIITSWALHTRAHTHTHTHFSREGLGRDSSAQAGSASRVRNSTHSFLGGVPVGAAGARRVVRQPWDEEAGVGDKDGGGAVDVGGLAHVLPDREDASQVCVCV